MNDEAHVYPGTAVGSLRIWGHLDVGNAIHFVLGSVDGPGVYLLGVDPETTRGGRAEVWMGGQAGGPLDPVQTIWRTPLSGDAGTISIVTLGDARITGTFSFTAGRGDDELKVTHGVFDLRLPESFVAAVP